MPKWIENWLKSRYESHKFIAWLMQWQIKQKAKKEAKAALKMHKQHKRAI